MAFPNIITLLFNGFTIALSLGFLLIILWQDARKELNQVFAALLFLVTLWNIGSLMELAFTLIDVDSPFILVSVSIMEVGFTGSSIAIYALTAVSVGVHTRRFRNLAFISLLFVIAYQVFFIFNRTPIDTPLYRPQPITTFFYITFDTVAFYLLWRYRRKIQSSFFLLGMNLFIIGQSLGFLNPELRIMPLSTNLTSLATLIISFALLQQEIITPLKERMTQVEAIHRVSLAITSQIAIDTVLDQITTQATNWLSADAAGIFLNNGKRLDLATVRNLPQTYIHSQSALGEGVAGTVAQTQHTIYLENYNRDWKQQADLPLASETFGSVICVPLTYGGDTIGVLMVIAGRQGRLLRKQDVKPLELLSSQAAVAIAHSRLFTKQQELTKQVEAARNQLETVLTSTQNPVVAVDRKFNLIFANPAAKLIFPITSDTDNLRHKLPGDMLPSNQRQTLKELHRNHTITYELEINHRFYLCHIGQLGHSRTLGWVAVLNDITQLKEVDRLKTEMVRMTSHDLKNPLQAAMANLELLADDLVDNADQEIQQSITTIGKQLNRMNRIITGILNLEKAKAGKLNVVSCQPNHIINNIIQDLTPYALEQNIAINTTIEDNVSEFWGDIDQIERAITNLIENAIKFTPRGGNIYIRIRNHKENILFEVEDTGIGIPEELQPYIFDRFLRGTERGQKGAEHISGSGLGLSLAKTIIDNHHGQIWLTSTVNQGTTFYISLPIQQDLLHKRKERVN